MHSNNSTAKIDCLCQIAEVSRSGYYKWFERNKEKDKDKDKDDYLLIKKIFDKGKGRLGWRSIKMKLDQDYGIIMNHKKIKRIKKEKHLITKIRKRNPYKMIMKKTQEHRTFNNILDRKFKQNTPGMVLCTDITYLYYSHSRKAYLQAIKDLASKEIVSFRVSNNLSMPFVLESIKDLKKIKILSNKTLIHSDQGFHYTNPEYINRVKELNLIQSMSRKGNCIDNSPMESFFGHLKDDLDLKSIQTFEELNDMISNYINYYNNERYQWDLKKMTPIQYRDHLLSINT